MADNEERLARLEEGLYFQEKRVAELDAALLFQQGQIDILEKKLAQAQENLASVLSSMDESGGTPSLPPHFMPEKY